ncbi:LamG-like jellyroll fold domain-containing protein [Micromonospora rubida]|uniref:LamG-like jellyroll fold domain-containing protein n=1 Tax=Micromonospora rubida TaxID=2697657 RepID=A0ABW7SCZ2_9ACTN
MFGWETRQGTRRRSPGRGRARRITRPLALALVGMLLLGSAAEGASGLSARPAGDRGRPAAPPQPGPDQRWGSAVGRGHLSGAPANRTIPRSHRSRYPQPRLGQAPPPARNEASLAPPPVTEVRGFDEAASRELPQARGAFERGYANPDGTETTEFSAAPVNYRTPQGGWAPIDARLRPAATGRAGGWRNTADSVQIRLAARADAPDLVGLVLPGGHTVGYRLAGAGPATGTADGATVTYPGALPNVDLTLESRAGGVKETLVLRAPTATRSFLFPLRLAGLTATLRDGQVVLADAGGTTRAVFPRGYMVDSAADEARSTGVTYQLVTDGGQPALRVTLDETWLRDPARVYPVRVDPTVALPVDSGSADAAMYVHGSSSSAGGSDLLVGTVNGANSASYVRFGSLVDRLRYHTVYGAQLQLVNYDSDSCKARPVTVHPVTASWTSGGNYSYPGPAVGSALASRSFAHGYVAFGSPRSACPAAAELFDLGAAGAKLVQRWVDGAQANHGLSVRASAGDSLSGKKFTGSGTQNPPKLFVTHSPYNAAYSIPKPVPDPPVLQNQAGKVTVTVTNRSATAWPAGDYYLAYRAYNARTGAPVGQYRAASLAAPVARGAKVTLEAAIKAMPPGSYFLDFTMVRTGGVVFTDHQVPPGRIVLKVIDIAPVMQELYPANGYQTPTLTPQLWARALDVDAPPGVNLSYRFEVCERAGDGTGTGCFDSGYQPGTAWTVPAGRLNWGKAYLWRAFVKDAGNEVVSPRATVLTAVPQPELTSRIAGAATAEQEQEFDAQTGNVSSVAVDATVTTVGPELNLVRTYNSLDPRRDGAFGAGWTTRYDMRLVPDDDGSGNVVVTYPDGQQVRFGRNPDGGFVPPNGRVSTLAVDGPGWKLTDRSNVSYLFSGTGRLTKITDAAYRSVLFTYHSDGTLARAQVSNSQTNTAGRSLRFTWTGSHVSSVSTDPVNGAPLIWNYTYDGDLLTRVCAPGDACTGYTYTTGSHYRSAVLDSRPESYWRLNETEGRGAASEIAVNLGKDAGSYGDVTLGAAGAVAGGGGAAATFNGTSSAVELPKGLLKKSRDGAVELWFKAPSTSTGGPLLGYQDAALSATSTRGVPLLYLGTDGRLRGGFGATGAIAPITSPGPVNNGAWHHVVLSVLGSTQTLYLDGARVGGTTSTTVDHSLLTFNQIGAAYASSPASWPGWGATARRHFSGLIDEVAVYSRPLGAAAVAAHHRYGAAADQLATVTRPSGKVAAEVGYDVGLDRVAEYTDRDGGTWKVGAPTVYGDATDLRRSVQVLDPANRPNLYEYDAVTGQLLRSGLPLGLETREEDKPGEPTSPPQPPVEVCSTPDPQDPAFCTTIPGSAGGPVFVRHPLDGMAVRTFQYDDQGNQTVVTNENGDSVTMTHDDRGNVVSKRTCQTTTKCHTSYTSYPATVTDPRDPRNDLPTASRDGRSAGATDNTYRTSYTYTATGELATETSPDGAVVSHTYTTGAEAAVGGGTPPAGLVLTSTDARGKVTRYGYHANGDLARVMVPSGLVTSYTYDALGRAVTETEVSDAVPAGATTTYAYDALSRLVSTTEPAAADVVGGVTHQQRTTTTYDSDGNAARVEVTDLLGGDATRTSTWEYDEHNRPIRVTDAEGGETAYTYDRFGNRTSMVDPNGNRYDYAYTARNALAEVRLRGYTGDGGPTTGDHLVLHSYSYDFAGRMASDTDAMGRRLEFEYYGDDQLRRILLKGFRDQDGRTRDYVVEENTYDGAGNRVRQAAGNGTLVTQQTFDRAGNVASIVVDPGGLARTSTFAYDANGNVTRTTRSGKASNVPWAMSTNPEQVDYAYDDTGNVVRETVAAGSTTRVTTYRYDQRGLVTSVTGPAGNVAGADPAAHTSTLGYDVLGRQVSETDPAVATESGGGAPVTVNPTRRIGYNTFDEQVGLADELGNVRRWTYDRVGRETSATAPGYWAPGTPSPYVSTTRTSYDAAGNVTAVTDPRGNTTRLGYDQLGRLVTRDQPGGTDAERALWRYTYTRTGELLSTTDPTGARTEATYDDLDRQVTATVLERRPVAATLTTRYSYDDAGNVTSVASPTGATTRHAYDAVGQLTRTTEPTGVATLFGYDHAGRRVRTSDSAGRTQQVTHDLLGRVTGEADLASDGTVLRSHDYGYDPAGNLTSATDPAGVATIYRYDSADRLVAQVEPVTSGSSITTTFGYDAAGNRTRMTDGRGNAVSYTYNSLGLLESVVEPATTAHPAAADRTWTIAYDVAGQPVRLTAPGGVVRQETYDAAGRLIRETGSGAGAPERSLGYDPAGRLTTVNAPGGSNTYTYNDRGQELTARGPSGTADFGYDGDGNLVSRVDAAGTARYGYVDGRLGTVTDGITGVTQHLGYDATGRLSEVDYGAGRRRGYGYDQLGRLASDTLRNAAGQVVSAIGYRYDVDDRLTGKDTTGTAGAGTHTYGYDLAGRLVSWTSSAGTVGYAWDAAGNRTRAGSRTASYDERNRLLADSDYTYTYTPRGTLASRTSSGLAERFDFDAFDRMVAAAGQTYTYDGLDRVASRNGTAFGYGGLGGEVVTDGTEVYARGPDEEVLAVTDGTDRRLTLSDEHGDVVGAFSAADSTLAGLSGSTAYDPFGQVLATDGDSGNLGFQGDWTDPATTQVNMGARWYLPATGGFVSRDSVTYVEGDSVLANRYTYAAGDPLGYTDPDGHWPSISCGWCKKAIRKVVNGGKALWNGAQSGLRWTWSGLQNTYSGIKNVVNWAWSGIKRAGGGISDGAKYLWNKGRNAINKVRDGWKWAQERAEQVRRAAVERAKQVTRAARKAIEYAAKHAPLRTVVAALKPIASGLKKVVSAAASLPAKVVATVRDVVVDSVKGATALYHKAVEKAGAVLENVSAAVDAVVDVAHAAAPYLKTALKVAADVSGVTDLAKCVTKGDLEACAWTALTVAGYLAGGAGGGAVRAARTASLAARHADEAGDAVRGGRKLLDAGSSCLRGANSFAADTRVRMADGGTKPISQVAVGDLVLATDPTTGRTEAQPVTDVIVGEGDKDLVDITVRVGDTTETITATEGHPFWVAGEDRWIDAGELAAGHRLTAADDRPATVTSVRAHREQRRVYNLTVDRLHTYHVVAGQADLLVHNADPRCPVHDDGIREIAGRQVRCNGASPACNQNPGTRRQAEKENPTTRKEEIDERRTEKQREVQSVTSIGNMAKGGTDAMSGAQLAIATAGAGIALGVKRGIKVWRRWRGR